MRRAEDETVPRVVAPVFLLGAKVGGVEQFKDVEPADRTPGAVAFEDAELEPLLAGAGVNLAGRAAALLDEFEGFLLRQGCGAAGVRLLPEADEEGLRLVVPVLDPAETNVPRVGVRGRVCDDEQRQPELARRLRGRDLGRVSSG
jgi:hypothetical protein